MLRGFSTSERHAGHALRHVEIEHRIGPVGDVVELPGERRANHRARVADLHPRPDAVRTAAPPGVDQPHLRVMAGDPVAEELRVHGRVQHHERGAEAGAERRLRLGDAPFGAGDLRGVAGEEVIHRAGRRQPRDRRQHAERIRRQHDDVPRMSRLPGRQVVVDELDRIRAARVLGQRIVIQIERARRHVHLHVLEHRAESPRRRVDLRFRLRRESRIIFA